MDPRFAQLAEDGAHFYGAEMFAKPEWKNNFNLAMDAQPHTFTTPNAGIPAFLTQIVDPDIIRILFAPVKAAQIFGEVKKGDWLTQTAIFPMVEHTGEVSSYGDWNNNGRTGLNVGFPQRQSYLYQIIKEAGDLEIERAGLAKIAWNAELDRAAVDILNRFQNTTYFFGMAGLQNYGLLNDPSLPASLTPATKTAGGTTWFTSGGAPNATANEVYNDILQLFEQLVVQAGGLVDVDMGEALTMVLSPAASVALKFTNAFGITVEGMLKQSFPNIKMETAVQYGAVSATNPQGFAAGNFVQLIATRFGGQETGYMAFSEKLRTHPVVRDLSSYKQKMTQGTWGAIIRMPLAIASMVGI